MKRLLIANRGEIALRVSSTARDMGIACIAIYPEDDALSLHVLQADKSYKLSGTGAQAYLDIEEIIAAAVQTQADAIHPGYGFLSESVAFAEACSEANITLIGPTIDQLAQFGNKTGARALAGQCDVPLVPGTNGATSLAEANAFMTSLDGKYDLLIKAVHGGGGRGMRSVDDPQQLEKHYQRCQSEAKMAFGNDAVYVEALIPKVKHIEIQIIGDGQGQVMHLWERECSVQRQNQKVIEIAPSPGLPETTRQDMIKAALKMAGKANYRGLGTFEFLVSCEDPSDYYFIETNARLQVEHTVTEAITGLDLVQLQIAIATGSKLDELGLSQAPEVTGYAIECRINMETLSPKAFFKPSGGDLTFYSPPSGPGVRVDGFGYSGYQTSTRFDSLLAKLIVHSRSNEYSLAVDKARRALHSFQIDGFETNQPFLEYILGTEVFQNGGIYTRYIDDNLKSIATEIARTNQQESKPDSPQTAGVKIDLVDPLAVLAHGKKSTKNDQASATESQPDGNLAITAPLQGTIIEIHVNPGEEVHAGQELIIMDAMKMEHVITAPASGTVASLHAKSGDAVFENHLILAIKPGEVSTQAADLDDAIDLDFIRPDLQEAITRHSYGLDESRQTAVAKRRRTHHRTVRENIEDICDPDTFIEYGSLTIAAQRRRRSVDDLMQNTPGDGMVCGIGSVNGSLVAEEKAQCVVMSYDYMVLAGTQGLQNHRKKDRMFELAEQLKIPVVLIAEGGGGRPGDTDGAGIAGLDCLAFQLYARLSGLVPRIGITTGRCFAGNAVLLGCSDIVIATEDSNIGIGGPAMIEGGGLGIFSPDEVGPMDVQVPNGVVDIAVKDEQEAVSTAKQLLSYFQGSVQDWQCADQRKLRFTVPENRLRVYDVKNIIRLIADTDSVLELRPEFGIGMVTAFIRIEGRPMGLIANDPVHLSGAIDSDGADKAARFMQLCDAFDIPILSLVDCPGIMVGPEIEKTALVRHASRVFVTSTSLTVPLFAVVLRKGYGLGAQAMTGGGFKASTFTVTWPTGEFGGMGLEGAVKLGYRKELEAIEDPEARRDEYEKRVAQMYDRGKAVNFATAFEIDEVIDPMDTRRWIIRGLKASPVPLQREGKKRPFIDTW
ncbi:MAG: carbamoyl-phosphate synthase large subunit [Gammaproteobacteria bacterium]|jgi:acetyl/propionyl-CoA carboxylase alpha subunit/acetyl-CoA carboxylase carboxyltransferase component|nr:carbamoyl-phosphate synthase large subunit [Gammaproteobacteria bacterium]